MVEVAAAVMQRPDGAFLLAQRPAGKVYEGYWEFPGGKVEAGEQPSAALARELREELGVDVETAYPWITRVYTYPHATVRLNFFRVTRWRGEPHPREEQAIAWQGAGARLAAPCCRPTLPCSPRWRCPRSMQLPMRRDSEPPSCWASWNGAWSKD